MRVLLFANNWTGWQVARCLRRHGETIVAVVAHPPQTARYRDDILAAAAVTCADVLDALELPHADFLQAVQARRPEIGVSAFFGYVLPPEILNLLPEGCINVHPAYLPYNRGRHPNVWSIVDQTPAGVTLHYMDAGVDTGDLIARQRVPIAPTDTGQTLYRRLEQACVDLFETAWPRVRARQVSRMKQDPGEGSHHRARDLAQLDAIDLDRQYTARELINVLRARTFPPYAGAYFEQDGRRVYLRLRLLTAEQLAQE